MTFRGVVPRIGSLIPPIQRRRCLRLISISDLKNSFPLPLPKHFRFNSESITSAKTRPDDEERRTKDVENPATGEVLHSITCASKDIIDDTVEHAHSVFTAGTWSRLPMTTRYQTLLNIANLLRASRHELAALETLQTGRPIREMTAQIERIPEWFEYHASLLRTHETRVLPFKGDVLNYTRLQPLGVVALITPFNHPLFIAIKKLAPALAAGNSVIIKPSEKAPFSAQYLVSQILVEAGVPPGTVQVLLGDGETGAQLASHEKIARIDFTGSTNAGRHLATIAGRGLIPITLEMGSKTAMLIYEDCDMEMAVQGVLAGGFIASGQTCVSGSRVIVEDSIYDVFTRRLAERTNELRIGRPWEMNTQIGPLIDKAAVRRCEQYVSVACNVGATLLAGGKAVKVDGKGNYFQPTLLGDCEPNHRSVREEIFGPVISILRSSSQDMLKTAGTKSQYTLAASIWTKNVARAHSVARDLQTGIVWVNAHHLNDPSSPWGGWGESGLGRENGLNAFRDNYQERSVIVNLDERTSGWFEKDDARYG